MAVLDMDSELLEREHGLASQVRAGVECREIEIAAPVEHLGRAVRVGRAEIEVLELRSDVELLESQRAHALECTSQDPARIALIRIAPGHPDVAEHSRRRAVFRSPGQDCKGLGVGHRDHVRLFDRVEPCYRRPVESHTALERVIELLRVDREALQLPEDVGEPEADEANAAILRYPFDVFGGSGCVLGHGRLLESWCRGSEAVSHRPRTAEL
jgi:hypothetical protein